LAGFLGPVWLPWGCGQSPKPRMAAVGRGRSPKSRIAVVGAWPVPWAPYGCREEMAGPLGPVSQL